MLDLFYPVVLFSQCQFLSDSDAVFEVVMRKEVRQSPTEDVLLGVFA